jgi:drug/metabolite transporter (DMT)-like permease
MRPEIFMLAFTAIYALCFTAIKAGLADAPPLLFGGLRALIGGLILLGILVLIRQPLIPAHWAWPWILALAITGTTVTYGAMFLSPGRTGAGIASVLGNLQPVLIIMLAAVFLGERLSRRMAVALVLGLVGVTLIAAPALAGPGAYGISGALLALAASGGAAVGSVIVKCMRHPSVVLQVSAWQLIIGSLPILGGAATVERTAHVHWALRFIGLLLFLALVGTAFPTAAWYWLLQRHDVGRLSLFLFLVPVFGLAIATLPFGERVGPLEGLGVLVTLAGIAVIAAESWHTPAAHDAASARPLSGTQQARAT